jgi:hypothetical protein
VFPFRTASDSETTAPVLSLVSVVSIDRSELFITVFVMIRDYCKTYLDSTCTNEINQEGQNEKQTYKPMCSGISQSTVLQLNTYLALPLVLPQ